MLCYVNKLSKFKTYKKIREKGHNDTFPNNNIYINVGIS